MITHFKGSIPGSELDRRTSRPMYEYGHAKLIESIASLTAILIAPVS